MLKVTLKRNWFGPDGTLYEHRNNPVSIPAKFRKKLPKDAKVVEEAAEPVGDQKTLKL